MFLDATLVLADKSFYFFKEVKSPENNIKTFCTLTYLMRKLIIRTLYQEYCITKFVFLLVSLSIINFAFPYFLYFFLSLPFYIYLRIYSLFRFIISLSYKLSNKLVFHTLNTTALTKNIPDHNILIFRLATKVRALDISIPTKHRTGLQLTHILDTLGVIKN